MIFVLERVSGPAVEPLTLAQAKVHLRITDPIGSPTVANPDDADITALITSAREWVEDYTGRALVEQTWRLTIIHRRSLNDVIEQNLESCYQAGQFRYGAKGEIALRKSPAVAITSFVSVDTAGTETAMGEGSPLVANYELREANSKWPRVYPLSGASFGTDDLRIEFRAGFAAGIGSPDAAPDVTVIPVRFTQAMKLWIEAYYDRDEKMMPLLLKAAEDLIRPERAQLSLA